MGLPAGRSFGLDLARTVAITLVIIAHFGHKNYDYLGFWGVELFFALSGFLIGQILWRNISENTTWEIKQVFNFWKRRWWRTLPNYYLFLIVTLGFHYLHHDESPALSRVINSIWFGQNLLHTHFAFYPVAWSLCIEEWFYFLFPLLLFVMLKLEGKPKPAFVITLGLFFFFSLMLRFIMVRFHVDGMSLRSLTLGRLDSIASGVAMAYLMLQTHPGKSYRIALFLLGALLIMLPAGIMYYGKKPLEYIENPYILLIVPLGFAMILPLVMLLKAPEGAFGGISTAVTKLSLWSYSIYLSHGPLMWSSYYLMSGLRNSAFGNLLSKVVALILTVTISALIYKFFELPFTRRRPAEYKKPLLPQSPSNNMKAYSINKNGPQVSALQSNE